MTSRARRDPLRQLALLVRAPEPGSSNLGEFLADNASELAQVLGLPVGSLEAARAVDDEALAPRVRHLLQGASAPRVQQGLERRRQRSLQAAERADRTRKWVAFSAEPGVAIVVPRHLLAASAPLRRIHRDLRSWVDARGLHLRWRGGRGGYNWRGHQVHPSLAHGVLAVVLGPKTAADAAAAAAATPPGPGPAAAAAPASQHVAAAEDPCSSVGAAGRAAPPARPPPPRAGGRQRAGDPAPAARVHSGAIEDSAMLPPRPRPAGRRPAAPEAGIDSLDDAQLLCIILATGGGGAPLATLAASLLGEHGGVGGLLRAGVAELGDHRGVGPAKAARLVAALEFGRRAVQAASLSCSPRLADRDAVVAWARPRLATLDHEELWVLCLDGRHGLRSARRVRGDSWSSRRGARRAARRAARGGQRVRPRAQSSIRRGAAE
jgi:hypothetical protein